MDEDAAQALEDFDWALLAIHEAGHAVIGLDLGFQILSVSIAGKDAAGATDYAAFRPKIGHGKPMTKALRTLEAYSQFCLAGPTAELWGDPNAFNLEDYAWPGSWPVPVGHEEPWAQDVMEVMRVAAKIGIPDWFARAARKTRERVGARWQAIEAVAGALLRHGTLTEEELVALVSGGEKRSARA